MYIKLKNNNNLHSIRYFAHALIQEKKRFDHKTCHDIFKIIMKIPHPKLLKLKLINGVAHIKNLYIY